MLAVQIRLRLQQEVENGAHYEAQQTYKATFYRYSGKSAHADAQALLRVRGAMDTNRRDDSECLLHTIAS